MERTAKMLEKGKGQASSQPKAEDVVKRAAQHAEQPDRRNTPQETQGRTSSQEKTSSSKDFKIKQEKHSEPGRNHRILEVRQAVWQQKPSDSVVSPSRQRRPSDTRRDGMSRSSSTSHLGERRWDAGRQREIPVLAGGGHPDDSSSQLQGGSKEKEQYNRYWTQQYHNQDADLNRAYNEGQMSTATAARMNSQNYEAWKRWMGKAPD